MLNYKRGQKIYKKAAMYTTVSAKRLHVLTGKLDEPIRMQKSVSISVLLPSCARAQVISMIDAYLLGKQAEHVVLKRVTYMVI